MNFCGLRKTPSPLCVNKKKTPEPPAPQKVVTTQISSCFQASPSSSLTWGLVFVNFPCWETVADVSGADLVTQMHGSNIQRIDELTRNVKSYRQLTTERTPSRWKICLKDVRVVGAPGHIFYDACRLLNIISKKCI